MAEQALGPRWTSTVRVIWTLGMPSNLVLIARRGAGA
jgi:hypothetical protein